MLSFLLSLHVWSLFVCLFVNFQVRFSNRIVSSDCFIYCFSLILRRCRVYISNPECVRWALGAVGGLVRAEGEVSCGASLPTASGRGSTCPDLFLFSHEALRNHGNLCVAIAPNVSLVEGKEYIALGHYWPSSSCPANS